MAQPGRPRSKATDRAVLRAALKLLADHGYDGLTMEGVAARAGVAKTTVYRRWPSRIDLVLELARDIAAPVKVGASGDLRTDLVAVVREIVTVLHDPVARHVIPRVLAEAREREELASGLRQFWKERRRLLLTLLEAGVESGELRPDLDLELAADAIYGPVYYRYLVTGAPLSAELAEEIVDQALDGIRGARRRRQQRTGSSDTIRPVL